MTEVEKMRSSQLADMSAPELQERFEHAKKLLAVMRGLSTYDDGYRELLEELVPGIPSIATTETGSGWANMYLSMPIVLFWMEDTLQSVLIRW